METTQARTWTQEPQLILWSTDSTLSMKTSRTFGMSNLCLVNRVKDFHSMRWHRMARTGKKSLVVLILLSSFPPRAFYVKVKNLANKYFLLLYSRLVTLGNLWISWFLSFFGRGAISENLFLYYCFNIIYKTKCCLESSSPNVYRGYKKISQQNWPLSGKENCSGRQIIS